MLFKLPLGIHAFATLRERGLLYVDKTRSLSALCRHKFCFFQRPRAFGLSVALSTLEELWRRSTAPLPSRRSCFDDLYIKDHWSEAPRTVIKLDFKDLCREACGSAAVFAQNLSRKLAAQAARPELCELRLSDALRSLLQQSDAESTVLLIDDAEAPFEYCREQGRLYEMLQEFYAAAAENAGALRFAAVFAHLYFKELGLFERGSPFVNLSAEPHCMDLCGFSDFEIYRALSSSPFLENADDTLFHDLRQLDDEFGFVSYSQERYLPLRSSGVIIRLISGQEINPHKFWLACGQSPLLQPVFAALGSIGADLDDFLEIPTACLQQCHPLADLPAPVALYQAGFIFTRDSARAPELHLTWSCPRARWAAREIYLTWVKSHAANAG